MYVCVFIIPHISKCIVRNVLNLFIDKITKYGIFSINVQYPYGINTQSFTVYRYIHIVFYSMYIYLYIYIYMYIFIGIYINQTFNVHIIIRNKIKYTLSISMSAKILQGPFQIRNTEKRAMRISWSYAFDDHLGTK